MHVIRATTDITVPDIEEGRAFYADHLGVEGEDMSLDWATRFVVPGSAQHIQLVSRDATGSAEGHTGPSRILLCDGRRVCRRRRAGSYLASE